MSEAIAIINLAVWFGVPLLLLVAVLVKLIRARMRKDRDK